MRKLIAIPFLSVIMFSCSEKKTLPESSNSNFDKQYLRSAQTDLVQDCNDPNGTPYAQSEICDKDYLVAIYNPPYNIATSKWLAQFHDSSWVKFFNGTIYLDSANSFPSANASTDYLLTFNPTSKRVGKSLFPSSVTYTAGTGISISSNIITNASPDRTVSLTGANGITATGTYPNFTISKKRQDVYSGTTDGSGNYTVTFGTSYSTPPSIYPTIPNQTATNQYVKVTSVSTTGFTVNAWSFTNILGVLQLGTSVITSLPVEVQVLEK